MFPWLNFMVMDIYLLMKTCRYLIVKVSIVVM